MSKVPDLPADLAKLSDAELMAAWRVRKSRLYSIKESLDNDREAGFRMSPEKRDKAESALIHLQTERALIDAEKIRRENAKRAGRRERKIGETEAKVIAGRRLDEQNMKLREVLYRYATGLADGGAAAREALKVVGSQ